MSQKPRARRAQRKRRRRKLERWHRVRWGLAVIEALEGAIASMDRMSRDLELMRLESQAAKLGAYPTAGWTVYA